MGKPALGANGQDRLTSLPGIRSTSRQAGNGRASSASLDSTESTELGPPRLRKPSRPSLSDRTIESLNALPATPKERRQSDFFSPGRSPMRSVSRPGSSLSRTGTNDSGLDGNESLTLPRASSPSKRLSVSAKPVSRLSLGKPGLPASKLNRRSVSTAFTTKLEDARDSLSPSRAPASPTKEASPSKEASPTRSADTLAPPPAPASLRVGRSKSPKPRPSLGSPFAPAKGEAEGAPSADADARRTVSSSSALRQQIAAAKAAARKEKAKHDSPQEPVVAAPPAFEVERHPNPFNDAPKDEKHMLRNRIKSARTDGRLNIAGMGFKEIPPEVREMYNAKAMEESGVNWAEVVDLTRFIAADNELETLDDALFPDRSAEELDAEELSDGNQFAGLAVLDLHGNALSAVPLGFRRLERLTVLNLNHNKLDNSAFDVLSQMKSLKELRLANNMLAGNLPSAICVLPHLETLDLEGNRLLGLPEALRELVSLKVLNVSGNQLTTLPMDALQALPLVELDASKNLLIASLFPLGGANGHPTLQVLNVANNSLAALTFMEHLDLPQLRSLRVDNNHLTVLPSVAAWPELTTLAAADNKISQFPHGFARLPQLRFANFTSNELRVLDPEIGRMARLEALTLAANPLREKRFLSMTAEHIKRELRGRLTPSEPDEAAGADEDGWPASPVTVIGASEGLDEHSGSTGGGSAATSSAPASASWALKAGGVLELTAKGLSDDFNDILGSFLKAHEVRDLILHGNRLTCVPPALWLGQELRSLDLSANPFVPDATYLSDDLELPVLQELNLSKCRLTTLAPLLTQLHAPNLRSLNVFANRLTGPVPLLRQTYPHLSTFLASDNRFDAVSAAALRGVANVSLASNNIAHLPAELGLLWDEGLRHLDVSSNAFRVPNYRILERGTEATLRWLRNKLPAGQAGGGGGGQVEEVE